MLLILNGLPPAPWMTLYPSPQGHPLHVPPILAGHLEKKKVHINATKSPFRERGPLFKAIRCTSQRMGSCLASLETLLCRYGRTSKARSMSLIIALILLLVIPDHPSRISQTVRECESRKMTPLSKIVWPMEGQPTYYEGLRRQSLIWSMSSIAIHVFQV